MSEKYQNYCTKCQEYKDYDCDLYRRQGEDTYDFRLCHKHEKALWKFLGEEATFPWEQEDTII